MPTPARKIRIGLAWLLAVTGSVVAGASTTDVNGDLLISLNGDIRSTSPGVNRDANTDTVMMHIVEGLVAYRENGLPAPLLAQVVDVSEDGKTYTFTLRDNVRFHNGAVLAADDVVWAWQRYLDPATNWT